MQILFNLNFRFILNSINCLMSRLNIITRGWTLCWKNIVEIIYLIIIAIIVMIVYVYYFAVFASLFSCILCAAIAGFIFTILEKSVK